MSDKTWNPEVERIRKAMMERFSDKLSMEEIAEFAYSFAVECRAPAPQPADAIERISRRLAGNLTICSQFYSEAWRAEKIREVLESELAATPRVTPKLNSLPDAIVNYLHSHLRKDEAERAAFAVRACVQNCNELTESMSDTVEGTSEQAPQELELEQEADGRWLAEFLRFPGVMAYGKSPEEAIWNAAKVLIESEQASPKKCPTCRSTIKNVYYADSKDPSKRCDPIVGRSDSWHSSPGTTKGTK